MKTAVPIGSLVLIVSFVQEVNSSQAQILHTVAPKVVVGAASKAKASAPAAPASAKHQSQKTAIGKGAVAIQAYGQSSFWVEAMDVNDDGVVENNQFLYDAKSSGACGCEFDTTGNPTDCGVAANNNDTGGVDVVASN